MALQTLYQTPTAKAYCALREKAGLSPKSFEAAEIGLANTIFGISIYKGDQCIAMGRLVGDGGCFLQIVDIAVDPKFQGQGLGKHIMLAIENHIKNIALPGCYVSLIADQPAFYEKLGYRKTAPAGLGMFKTF